MIPITKESVGQVYRSTLGVPFKKGGVDRSGVDCSGLVPLTRGELGLETDYPSMSEMFPDNKSWMPRKGLIEKYMTSNYDRIPCEEWQQGDAITFNITGETEQHIGYLVDEPKYGHPFIEGMGLLHITLRTGVVVIEPMSEKYWGKRAWCYRIRELID